MKPWDDQQLAALRGLVADGLSASEIGSRMGRSRNAIIGKILRLCEGGEQITLARSLGARKPSQTKRPVTTRQSAPRPVASPTGSPAAGSPAPVSIKPIPDFVSRASDIIVVPMPFLRAMDERRCLFFAADAMTAGGPDMPVCGCRRASLMPGAKPYCRAHLDTERVRTAA